MTLSDPQITRYARHLILKEVGESGQRRLLDARVLIVGLGGLGSPVSLYLAAAGVGRLGLVDGDRVDLSNLQRQIAHNTERIGQAKVASAAAAVAAINPEIAVDTHDKRLTPENADRLIADYDLVVDGSDNFPTRYLLNDHCRALGRPLVSGALLRFEGQVTTFRPDRCSDGRPAPCYRCLYPAPPPDDARPRCDQVGIFGAVAGVVGTWQASEVLKELLELGESLAGILLLYDALGAQIRRIRYNRDPDCPVCASTSES